MPLEQVLPRLDRIADLLLLVVQEQRKQTQALEALAHPPESHPTP